MFKHATIECTAEQLQDELDFATAEGFELVSVLQSPSFSELRFRLFFKKPLEVE